MRGVSKAYTTTAGVRIDALRDVSLDVAAGQMVAVTAPSASGKSTLLQVLGAMDRPDSGEVLVDGVDLTALSSRELVAYRRSIGFVFQRFHLLPALSALDNVLAPLLPYRVSFDKLARASELLDLVGLGGRGNALPSQLSGGQQQRVAIARALVGHPRLLLADEPTGNLDSATGAGIIQLLHAVNAERGTTVVLATHDSAVASSCGLRVALLDGHVVDPERDGGTPAPHEGAPTPDPSVSP